MICSRYGYQCNIQNCTCDENFWCANFFSCILIFAPNNFCSSRHCSSNNRVFVGLHLYTHSNLLKGKGKSCCLLGIDASCRKTCFLSTNSQELRQACQPKEEVLIWVSFLMYDYLTFIVILLLCSRKICFRHIRKT